MIFENTQLSSLVFMAMAAASHAEGLVESRSFDKKLFTANVAECHAGLLSEGEFRTIAGPESADLLARTKSALAETLGSGLSLKLFSVCEASDALLEHGPLAFQEQFWIGAQASAKPSSPPREVAEEIGNVADPQCVPRLLTDEEVQKTFRPETLANARYLMAYAFLDRPYRSFVATQCRPGMRVYQYRGVENPL